MLDELAGATGWSRANTRRQVCAAAVRKGPRPAVKRPPGPRTYGYDTLRMLIRVWMLAGRPSGKYLAATMGLWLPKRKLEQREEFGDDAHRLDDHTRFQLLQVLGATIDRLLKPTHDGMRLTGVSGTKPDPLLRNSFQVRKAGDEHEQAPGFCEADLVLLCGPTLNGQFCRTVTVTDVHPAWDREHRSAQRHAPLGAQSGSSRFRVCYSRPASAGRLRWNPPPRWSPRRGAESARSPRHLSDSMAQRSPRPIEHPDGQDDEAS